MAFVPIKLLGVVVLVGAVRSPFDSALAIEAPTFDITRRPADQRVLLSSTATFECGVDDSIFGTDQIQWEWQFNNQPLDTGHSSSRYKLLSGGSKLQIQAVRTDSDIGEYKCVATRKIDGAKASASAQLTVLERPYSPTNLQAKLVADEKKSASVSDYGVVENDKNRPVINVTWSPPAFDGNSPVLKFVLQFRQTNADNKNFVTFSDNVAENRTFHLISGSTTSLKPAHTYEFRIAAENAVGKSQFSEPSNPVTVPQIAPSAPPHNVNATAISSTSIRIGWSAPIPETAWNGPLTGYTIRYKLEGYNDIEWDSIVVQQNEPSKNEHEAVLTNLITWRPYVVQVAANNAQGVGVFSASVHVQTLQGEPSKPPQNIRVKVVNSTALELSWLPPGVQFFNGRNRGYRMRYTLVAENITDTISIEHTVVEQNKLSQSSGDNLPHRQTFLLTNLRKFSNYSIEMACVSGAGAGKYSDPILVQTGQDVPGRVQNVKISQITDSSMTLSWQPPIELNGVLRLYNIRVESAQNDGIVDRNVTSSPAVFDRLQPSTRYAVVIAAYTDAGRGAEQRVEAQTSVPPVLPEPPQIVDVLAAKHISFTDKIVGGESANSGPTPTVSVMLKLKPGFDGNATIQKWRVQYQQQQMDSDNLWHSYADMPFDSTANSLKVSRLRPATNYRFRVAAVNIVGPSPFSSPPSAWLRSANAPPARSPDADLRARTVNATALRVVWTTSALYSAADWNGEVGGYKIFFRQRGGANQSLSASAPRRFTAAPPSLSSNWQSISVDSQFSYAVIDNLQPNSMYEIKMQAFNSLGPSPQNSSIVEQSTFPSAPLHTPNIFDISASSATEIKLQWTPVDTLLASVEGYRIFYSKSDDNLHFVDGYCQLPCKMLDVPTDNTKIMQKTISNLLPATNYSIKIAPYNPMGIGPLSTHHIVKTRDGKSSPPTRMRFPQQANDYSVLISWSPPFEPNGQVSGYELSFMPSNLQRNFDSLPLYVFANNSRTTKTMEAGRIYYTLSELMPMAKQYERLSPLISLLNSPSDGGASAPPTRFYAVLLDNLQPRTQYSFRLRANNSAGFGAEQLATTTTVQRAVTAAQMPQPPEQIYAELSSDGAVNVRWAFSDSENVLPIRYYELELTTDEGRSWRALPVQRDNIVPANLTSVVVSGLDTAQRYRFRVRVVTDVGASKWSSASDAVETPRTTKTAFAEADFKIPPEVVEIIPQTSTSAVVRLRAPNSTTSTLQTLVRFRQFSPLNGNGTASSEIFKQIQVPATTTSAQLADLLPGQYYEIQAAYFRNAAGVISPFSPPRIVFIGEAVPAIQPVLTNVSTTVDGHHLKVEWTVADDSVINPDELLGFKVFAYKTTDNNTTLTDSPPDQVVIVPANFSTSSVLPLTTTMREAIVDNLHPYTKYAVRVAAFNAAGDGPKSSTMTERTLADKPSAPLNLRLLRIESPSSVSIAWRPPQEPNGLVSHFIVRCDVLAGEFLNKTVIVKSPTKTETVIGDLEYNSSYSFSVQAVNTDGVGGKWSEPVEVNIAPGPFSPSTARRLTATKTSDGILLKWLSSDSNATSADGFLVQFVKNLPSWAVTLDASNNTTEAAASKLTPTSLLYARSLSDVDSLPTSSEQTSPTVDPKLFRGWKTLTRHEYPQTITAEERLRLQEHLIRLNDLESDTLYAFRIVQFNTRNDGGISAPSSPSNVVRTPIFDKYSIASTFLASPHLQFLRQSWFIIAAIAGTVVLITLCIFVLCCRLTRFGRKSSADRQRRHHIRVSKMNSNNMNDPAYAAYGSSPTASAINGGGVPGSATFTSLLMAGGGPTSTPNGTTLNNGALVADNGRKPMANVIELHAFNVTDAVDSSMPPPPKTGALKAARNASKNNKQRGSSLNRKGKSAAKPDGHVVHNDFENNGFAKTETSSPSGSTSNASQQQQQQQQLSSLQRNQSEKSNNQLLLRRAASGGATAKIARHRRAANSGSSMRAAPRNKLAANNDQPLNVYSSAEDGTTTTTGSSRDGNANARAAAAADHEHSTTVSPQGNGSVLVEDTSDDTTQADDTSAQISSSSATSSGAFHQFQQPKQQQQQNEVYGNHPSSSPPYRYTHDQHQAALAQAIQNSNYQRPMSLHLAPNAAAAQQQQHYYEHLSGTMSGGGSGMNTFRSTTSGGANVNGIIYANDPQRANTTTQLTPLGAASRTTLVAQPVNVIESPQHHSAVVGMPSLSNNSEFNTSDSGIAAGDMTAANSNFAAAHTSGLPLTLPSSNSQRLLTYHQNGPNSSSTLPIQQSATSHALSVANTLRQQQQKCQFFDAPTQYTPAHRRSSLYSVNNNNVMSIPNVAEEEYLSTTKVSTFSPPPQHAAAAAVPMPLLTPPSLAHGARLSYTSTSTYNNNNTNNMGVADSSDAGSISLNSYQTYRNPNVGMLSQPHQQHQPNNNNFYAPNQQQQHHNVVRYHQPTVISNAHPQQQQHGAPRQFIRLNIADDNTDMIDHQMMNNDDYFEENNNSGNVSISNGAAFPNQPKSRRPVQGFSSFV